MVSICQLKLWLVVSGTVGGNFLLMLEKSFSQAKKRKKIIAAAIHMWRKDKRQKK